MGAKTESRSKAERHFRWSPIALAAFSALTAIAWNRLRSTTPDVRTTSGLVRGHSAFGAPGVYEYLGVPYADPPTGHLRWEPPQAYTGAERRPVVNAAKFGASCPARIENPPGDKSTVPVTPHGEQILVSLLKQPRATYSEDCLTLNVWTSKSADKKAVLVWIHGGGYNTGTTDNAGYSGKYLAQKEDVVVVTVNYRLNIFGFPGIPGKRNNLGILDQRLALEWTRDNIAAFGGDPDRITLFGQSAGASSVDYHMYAWPSDPIAAGFIAQSGTALSPGSQADAGKSADAWYTVVETLSCGSPDSDADDVLRCMKAKDWAIVQDAIPRGKGLSAVLGKFGPTIDESVIFSDYTERSVAGKVARRPLVIGNTHNEAGLFKASFARQNVTFPEAKWEELTHTLFTCSTAARALASVALGMPTWRYRWFGDYPSLTITESPPSGAWHGSEVAIIFDTSRDIQAMVKRTAAEEAMTTYMRGAWAAFAKDPAHGLTRYGFAPYDPTGETLLRLGFEDNVGPNEAHPSMFDEGCTLPQALVDLQRSDK